MHVTFARYTWTSYRILANVLEQIRVPHEGLSAKTLQHGAKSLALCDKW